MKISLFQGILFTVFGLGALIGLFVFATYTSTSGTGGVGTVIIWGTLPADAMNALLTKAAQTDTTLKSVSYVQQDPASLPSALAAAIATGAPPDLVLASQEQLHSLASFLAPVPLSTLSAGTFTSTFVSEGNLFAAPGGTGYYGVPFLVDPLVLFSNNAILSSDGIAKPPATWEALTGLVPSVALFTPARQITRALIALGTYDNVHNARAILSALFLQTGVPVSTVSSTGFLTADFGIASSGGTPPGPSVVSFYTQFADPSKVSYTWNASLTDSRQAFQNGDLALYLGFASEAAFFEQANPNLSFTVSPLPQPGTAPAKSTFGLSYAFLFPRGAANSAGAYQAAGLLTSTANETFAAEATGLAPATRAALAAPPVNDPIAAVTYASALYTAGWLSPAPAAVDTVFSGMIGDVVSGRLTIISALTTAAQSLSARF